MKTLIKTTDPTVPSYVIDLLDQAGIMVFEFDRNVSILEGSIGIFPRRIMVADDDFEEARRLLKTAGLDHELEADDKKAKITKNLRRGRAFNHR